MKAIGAKLTIVCISLIVIMLAGQSYAKIDPKSIVGIWLFDEGKGDTVRDSSFNGNDGKIFGAKWVEGKKDKGLEFDGVSHVRIPPSVTTDDYLDGFTYLLWVKPLAIPPGPHTRLIERDWHNPNILIGPTDFYGSIIFKGGIDNSQGQI
ncbi:MAG: hypothetical protein ACE5K2_00965 [Candidatus Zixiibacteriota bacterium]